MKGSCGGGGRRKSTVIGLPSKPARKDHRADEDLLLFHEMLRRDRERTLSLLQPVSDEFDANPCGNYPMYRVSSGKKGGGLETLLHAGNDKNDYDWLKTPPATPLFPSLEMEATGPQLPIDIQPGKKYSRFSGKSEATKKSAHEDSRAKSQSAASSRSVTPNLKYSNSTSSSPKPPATNPVPLPGDRQKSAATELTRKSVFPENATKFRKPSCSFINLNDAVNPVTKTDRARNATDQYSKDSKPRSRGVSPLVRSRIPSTFPEIFSDVETPRNLRTNLPFDDRSTSATRGRVVPSSNSSSTAIPAHDQLMNTKPERVLNPRRQSCSPSVLRGRKPDSKQEYDLTQRDKLAQGSSCNINGGVVFGSRMVEKMMNARKSVAGDDKDPKPRFPRVTTPRDGAGFGKTSSLDHMALKQTETKGASTNYPIFNN